MSFWTASRAGRRAFALFSIASLLCARPSSAAPFLLTAAPAFAYVGQSILFTAANPFKTATLTFGDGASTVLGFGSSTVAHVYTSPGTYIATLSAALGVAPLSVSTAERVAPMGGALTANPPRGVVGAPFAFAAQDVRPPGFPVPPPLLLSFGDGSAPVGVPATATYPHAYAKPGLYVVQPLTTGGVALAATTVEADAQTARVPIGEIFSVTPSVSPVLGGSFITLNVNYNLLLPATPYASQQPALEAVVDLLAPNGRVIRRSDPFSVPYSAAEGPALRSVSIPYVVPVDASGPYKLRVYLRSAERGAVAVANAIPFLIVGGPDPAPKVVTGVHANGAIEAGPHAGQTGRKFNANLTTALQWPAGTLALSGLFDSASERLDPNLSYLGGPPGKIAAPDSQQTQPQGDPAAILGLTQAKLPAILGGGDPIRGFDWTNTAGPFTYQFGYGYTQIVTATQSAQYGSIFDVSRALPKSGALDFTLFTHADESTNYVSTPSIDDAPYASHAAVLEYHQQPIKDLTLLAAGSVATADNELDAQRSASDASDTVQLRYGANSTTGTLEYDNAGEYMGVGGGPGALADRADLTSQLQFPVSRISTLAFGWSDADTRSAFSRQTDTFLTYTLTPSTLNYTLSLRSDGQRAAGVQTTTDELSFGVTKTGTNWNLALNGNLTALRDALGNASSTTRTASIQYMRQAGRHTLALGINANAIGGAAATAQVGETFSYGFPFATRANGNGFELISQLANMNSGSHAAPAGARDVDWNTILSYHFGPHVSFGIVGDVGRHYSPAPLLRQSNSALRARLDVQL